MANRILALVRKMFNFAIEHEWIETNPCHLVKQPGQEKQRERRIRSICPKHGTYFGQI